MRHQKHHASLGVTREHRESMLSNLAAALITHGRIQTTLTKARVLRPFIEKIITKAKHAAAKTEKKDAVHLRRLVLRDLRDETAVTAALQREIQGVREPRGRLHADLQARAPAPGRCSRDGPDRIRQGRGHGLQEVEGQEGLQGPQAQGSRSRGRGNRGTRRGKASGSRGRGKVLSPPRGPQYIQTRRSLPSARFLFTCAQDVRVSRSRRRILPAFWRPYSWACGSSTTGGTTCDSTGSAGGRPSTASAATGSTRPRRGPSCAPARGAATRTPG